MGDLSSWSDWVRPAPLVLGFLTGWVLAHGKRIRGLEKDVRALEREFYSLRWEVKSRELVEEYMPKKKRGRPKSLENKNPREYPEGD